MSVEATALSRSKLEQKDRAELAAIVEAMGGKAGSRAKKADLVDQVLELAGSGNGTAAASAPESAPQAHERAEASPAVALSTVAAPALEDEPPADWEVAVAAESSGERDRRKHRPPAKTTSLEIARSAPKAKPGQQGQPRNQGQGGPGQGQRDDGEGGNRRRRRRGSRS